MTLRRGSALLELQHRLHQDDGNSDSHGAAQALVFQSAGAAWALPSQGVARVLLPENIVSLEGILSLPSCVVGLVAGDNEMLSVVDVGLLFGREGTHSTMKRRLIVCGDGPLKGFALLVERVMGQAAMAELPAETTQLSPASLHTKIAAKAVARSTTHE